jgi:hypothetical protein
MNVYAEVLYGERAPPSSILQNAEIFEVPVFEVLPGGVLAGSPNIDESRRFSTGASAG